MADTCSSCGAPIEWGITVKGRRIPIDPAPEHEFGKPNVKIVGRFGNGTLAVDVVKPGEGSRVSHFFTCPDAKRHRKGNR